MSVASQNPPQRCGVVDLGSNSVRLVVYEGAARNPMPIFNEKAVLRLGQGLQTTGKLNEDGVAQALTVLDRYRLVAQSMGASPFEIIATAAVRDALNGPEFIADLKARLPDARISVLSGDEEAAYSADGVICGIPDADGLLADIGGGSMELVRLASGTRGQSQTLRLGVIRLAERAQGNLSKARAIVDEELSAIPWLNKLPAHNLYLVGGAWRALARIHLLESNYPLQMVHHYTIEREAARDLADFVASAPRRTLEKLRGAPRRRLDDMPYAALALRRLLRVTNVRRVVFSASGLREGWFMRQMPGAIRAQDPLLSAVKDMAQHLSRDPSLPPDLLTWTAPLFTDEKPAEARLREAMCWLSDIGSHDHPEFRAEQAFWRVLRQPGIGFDHQARAFLALGIAVRYEANLDEPFLNPARQLLDLQHAKKAEILGAAMRLAYTLSAGTRDLLTGTKIRVQGSRLILELQANKGVFAGESVLRRLERLAFAMGLEPSAAES